MIKLTFNTLEELKQFAMDIVGLPAQETGKTAPAPAAVTTPAVVSAPTPVAAPAPAPASVPTPASAPVQTPAPAPAPAPSPAKMKQDIQKKAIQLMDAGKQDQLQALLTKYNVPALPSLGDDQLAGFMADLEAM